MKEPIAPLGNAKALGPFVLVLLIWSIVGCGRSQNSTNTEPLEPIPTGELDHTTREEATDYFLAIADRIERSENRYLGQAQIPRLQKQLDDVVDHQHKVNILLQLTCAPSSSEQSW